MQKPKKEVKKPVVPLNEQPGYCRKCAGCKFKLSFVQGELLRKCRGCGDEIKI